MSTQHHIWTTQVPIDDTPSTSPFPPTYKFDLPGLSRFLATGLLPLLQCCLGGTNSQHGGGYGGGVGWFSGDEDGVVVGGVLGGDGDYGGGEYGDGTKDGGDGGDKRGDMFGCSG